MYSHFVYLIIIIAPWEMFIWLLEWKGLSCVRWFLPARWVWSSVPLISISPS